MNLSFYLSWWRRTHCSTTEKDIGGNWGFIPEWELWTKDTHVELLAQELPLPQLTPDVPHAHVIQLQQHGRPRLGVHLHKQKHIYIVTLTLTLSLPPSRVTHVKSTQHNIIHSFLFAHNWLKHDLHMYFIYFQSVVEG